jgi:molybdate/tungstate transport system substrate-binding protein
MPISRRDFVAAASAAAAACAMPARARAAATPLAVAYAGSMTAVMEQAIGPAADAALGVAMRGRAQGANALAHEIVEGSLPADVFISVTAEPMEIVLAAGRAHAAQAIARTEMVIAYAPRGKFAAGLAAGQPWWRILEMPGIRFGRTDPATDPQGRNIIYVCELAERYYRLPGLAARILGGTFNPRQIFAEAMVEGRLQSGELDAASAYLTQPGAFGLPYVTLPAAINLGGPVTSTGAGAEIALTIGGHTYHPQPLVFYAAAVEGAPHAAAARAFVRWLGGRQAQALLRKHGYDAPGAFAPLLPQHG